MCHSFDSVYFFNSRVVWRCSRVRVVGGDTQGLARHFVKSDFKRGYIITTVTLIVSASGMVTKDGNTTNFAGTARRIDSCRAPMSGLVGTVTTIVILINTFGICFGVRGKSRSMGGAVVLAVKNYVTFVTLSRTLPLFFRWSFPNVAVGRRKCPIFGKLRGPLRFVNVHNHFLALTTTTVNMSFMNFVNFSVTLKGITKFVTVVIVTLIKLVAVCVGRHNKLRGGGETENVCVCEDLEGRRWVALCDVTRGEGEVFSKLCTRLRRASNGIILFSTENRPSISSDYT